MLKSLTEQSLSPSKTKRFLPIFFRTPNTILNNFMVFTATELINDSAVPTSKTETIPSDLILRSVGYKSISVDDHINFDTKNGRVCNKNGKINV